MAWALPPLLGLAAVLLVRALPAEPPPPVEPVPPLALDTAGIAQRLARAIQIQTITDARPMPERAAEFVRFHDFLRASYPRVHSALQQEKIGGYSLLYTWPGSDRSLRPILLMGHLDVVPVAAGSESDWQQPPFSGALANGEVWGRGALDDKQHVISILDAVELLLAQGFAPRRTVLLFFGHDEEGAGHAGARVAAQLLQQRKVQLEYVIDEGGIIAEDMIAGVRQPVALVRAAEKGYLTLELSVKGAGGHSSTPARPTSIGVLARALAALEANPFPQRMVPPLRGMLDATAAEQSLPLRVVLRNLWLFKPLVLAQMAKQPATDAVTRTSIAPTMLQGSPKDNVLPTEARATINFRVLPGETSETVMAHVRRAVADERVQVRPVTVSEPPPAAPTDSPQFELIARTIRQIHPDVLVAPFLLTGATDSRHFAGLTRNVYGFSSARGGGDLIARAHGTNERIAVRDLAANVHLYLLLICNSQ